MRLCFPQYFESKSRFLTYTIVRKVLVDAGHEVVNNMDGCDAVLFSMCDATEYRKLMQMRKRSRGNVLIVGGAYAFNFWSCKLQSDGVWVGEVFEMAECRTIDDLFESPHCFTGDGLPVASQRIDWDKVPVAQIAPKKCYYWGGVGCKNRCAFCFTSWTHRHQANSDARIKHARSIAKSRKLHLMVSSNEYDNDPGASTFDMLLRDYVNTPVNANVVRCGIEFATDETRGHNGKPVTENDIYHALQKAAHESVSLRLFHITGLDTVDEWDAYITAICSMLDRLEYRKLLNLGFNNLQYQNYTPLYRRRYEIDPSHYIDIHKTREWYDELRQHTRSVLVGAPSTFQHVCCRMGVELATTREQMEFWTAMMVNPNKKLTVDSAYSSLMDSGVLDTPRMILHPADGKITVDEHDTGKFR